MLKQLNNNRWPLIFSIATCFTLPACTQTDTVESALQEVQSILVVGNVNNKVHYQLTYDPDYPCSAELQENWKDSDSDWHHTYRFELTDIAPNTFIQSKNGRRAIVYGGYKVALNDTKKVFSEIRINNIQYRASLNTKDQQLIINAMNKAIALCEEKYSF